MEVIYVTRKRQSVCDVSLRKETSHYVKLDLNLNSILTTIQFCKTSGFVQAYSLRSSEPTKRVSYGSTVMMETKRFSETFIFGHHGR